MRVYTSILIYICCCVCRDIVPDHYKMILDIIPDQFTVASMDTCNPTENDPCPEGFKEGDSYLNRNLYIKCPYSDGKVMGSKIITPFPIPTVICIILIYWYMYMYVYTCDNPPPQKKRTTTTNKQNKNKQNCINI